MPNLTMRPWFDVLPWAQVMLPDGGPWTVLPFSGLRDTPALLLRELWRQPYDRQAVAVHPMAPVTLLEPDMPEAVAAITALGATVIETEDEHGLTILASVLYEAGALAGHLRDSHGVTIEQTSRLRVLTDAQRYHAGLHQQVAVYPLKRPHWHR